MRILAIAILTLTLNLTAFSQSQVITTPRVSPKASISQTVGITEITIEYSRPSANGREIWGSVVPYGMNNLGWGTAESAPWRAGANENTIIHFSTPVSFYGTEIPAGSYGLFMVVEEDGNVEVLLSSNYTSWGSYFYDEREIVARGKTSMNEHVYT